MLQGLTCLSVTKEHPLLKISAWKTVQPLKKGKKKKEKVAKAHSFRGGGISLNQATSTPVCRALRQFTAWITLLFFLRGDWGSKEEKLTVILQDTVLCYQAVEARISIRPEGSRAGPVHAFLSSPPSSSVFSHRFFCPAPSPPLALCLFLALSRCFYLLVKLAQESINFPSRVFVSVKACFSLPLQFLAASLRSPSPSPRWTTWSSWSGRSPWSPMGWSPSTRWATSHKQPTKRDGAAFTSRTNPLQV